MQSRQFMLKQTTELPADRSNSIGCSNSQGDVSVGMSIQWCFNLYKLNPESTIAEEINYFLKISCS